MNDYEKWLQSCLVAGIPALSLDTCCRLLAIVYVMGGSMEAFNYDVKLKAEWHYAQQRLNIGAGNTVDEEGAALLKKYVGELEAYYDHAPINEKSSSPLAVVHPDWVAELMRTRYNITNLWL
jgi:hypothetical protein